MKKRIVLAIFMIAALATLAGCGNKENTSNVNANEEATENEVVEEVISTDYITLGDYSAITIEIEPKKEITDEDVDAKYQEVINANTSYEKITGKVAESGDLVEIDYIGSVDGEEFDSGTIGADGEDFLLGSDTMIEGFEEAIIGMSIDEQKIADISFPADYYNEELAGKLAQFDITLKAIKKVVYPETLTKEMIMAANPDCKTEEELKAAFLADLEEEADTAYLESQKSAIMFYLVENATYAEELPEAMVTDYYNSLVSQAEQWGASYGIDLETLVSTYFYQTMDEFYADNMESAIMYTKQDLVLAALSDIEKIEVSSEDILAYAEDLYEEYEFDSAESMVEIYGEDVFVKVIEADRVFDMLLANTTTNDLVVE